MKNSKVFVAGGTGMVGSAIIRKLIEKGYTSIVSNYHRREPTENTDKVEFVKLDLTNQYETERFFKVYKPEYVYLAAAKVGGILANNTYRADFIYQNLAIELNVIHNSYRYEVKKLLFLGSTCIYPKHCPQPMKEDYLLTGELEYTNEPYAVAKIAGIKMCESYNLQYGTNFISIMPTNLYGPGDNFDLYTSHVIPALLRKVHIGKLLENQNWEGIRKDLNKNPIEDVNGEASKETILSILAKYGILYDEASNSVKVEIWGSGKPRREFLWVDDLADACVFIMERVDFKDLVDPNSKEIRNTHINIGTGVDISIKELCLLIKELVGFAGEFYFNTNKPDGMMVKITDTTKLNKLGWRPRVGLKEGIERLYRWYVKEVL